MDVLVYPAQHPSSNQLSQSLNDLLSPNYVSQTLPQDLIAAPGHAWQTSCALLVLLTPPHDHAAVRKYIEGGGRILALGVHARSGSGVLELAPGSGFGLGTPLGLGLGLSSTRDTSTLRLSDEGRSLYITFPQSPSTISSEVTPGDISVFRTAAARLDVTTNEERVLGRYLEEGTLAGIISQSGKISLWSCASPLAGALLEKTVVALGMSLPPRVHADGPQVLREQTLPLPQLLLANPRRWDIQKRIVDSLFVGEDVNRTFARLKVDDGTTTEASFSTPPSSRDKDRSALIMTDINDNFAFHFPTSFPSLTQPDSNPSAHPLLDLLSPANADPASEKTKHILVPAQPLTSDQEATFTPHFSPQAFFKALDDFYTRDGAYSRAVEQELASEMGTDVKANSEKTWHIGEALLYGEIVTSTQTMLDKNPTFLRALPSPLLSLATVQLAGRGRGKNTWVSPSGCLQMSLRLRVKLKGMSPPAGSEPAIRPSNLVFIQYLFALAVTEACHALDSQPGGWAQNVRLKWPNDIYGVFPIAEGNKTELRKLGGILVNTSFGGGEADIVIGCGINVLDDPPIASLAQLTGSIPAPSYLTVERTAAAILAKFEGMWSTFLEKEDRGFEPFMGLYLERWLHSDQMVTLTTTTPSTDVRIVGITPDHGLLRTVPVSQGFNSRGSAGYIDLQPDGNSFDMMKGLIKTKTS